MMASRRTRIKGIANIPQRRKQPNENEITETNSKIDENQQIDKTDVHVEETSKQELGKLNLNSDVSDNNVDEIAKNEEHPAENNVNAKFSELIVEENEQCDKSHDNNEKTSKEGLDKPNLNSDVIVNVAETVENPSKINENPKVAEVIKENVEDNKTVEKNVQKPAPVRRKFIKPTVAIGAINRKLAKVKDKKEAKNEDEIKNKIVILDEIITHKNLSTSISDEAVEESGTEIEIPQQSEDGIQIIQNPPINTPVIEKDSSTSVTSNVITASTETEYPIPPPSPTKTNRARIKAIPRFSQRHTSFSASESEDESKRNNRHRTDSVCSTTSIAADNTTIPESAVPQKPKEFNALIQKKCRRTEQSRKLAEARRDFHQKFGNNKPDRQKLTMMDLIFYNPTTNLMSDSKRNRNNSVITENGDTQQEKQPIAEQQQPEQQVEQQQQPEEENNVDDPPTKPNSDEENDTIAPQIKIDAQGEIVIDEQSLVIENKTNKKNWEALQNSRVIDGNFETGYGVYKRVKRSKDWTKEETLKFYKALNTLGTDFTLMSEFFPRRSRRELKMKFKKEERINKQFIDRALLQPCNFDYEEFKHEVDMEEKELAAIERQKELDFQLKKEIGRKRKVSVFRAGHSDVKPEKHTPKPVVQKPKKRRLDIMNVLSESDADVSDDDSDDNDGDEKILQNMQRPTRSGRVPKILDRYKSDINTKKTDIEHKNNTHQENGSLMVVESTTPDGASIFKVFMVTDDQQNKIENGAKSLKSICTLRAETSEDDDEDNAEIDRNITIKEENITTPAEIN